MCWKRKEWHESCPGLKQESALTFVAVRTWLRDVSLVENCPAYEFHKPLACKDGLLCLSYPQICDEKIFLLVQTQQRREDLLRLVGQYSFILEK